MAFPHVIQVRDLDPYRSHGSVRPGSHQQGPSSSCWWTLRFLPVPEILLRSLGYRWKDKKVACVVDTPRQCMVTAWEWGSLSKEEKFLWKIKNTWLFHMITVCYYFQQREGSTTTHLHLLRLSFQLFQSDERCVKETTTFWDQLLPNHKNTVAYGIGDSWWYKQLANLRQIKALHPSPILVQR